MTMMCMHTDPRSVKLEESFSDVCLVQMWVVVTYAARRRQPEDYRAVSVVRPKQLDLPDYLPACLSACLCFSICLSVSESVLLSV